MKIKEVRVIYPNRVQEFCVENDYYTRGDVYDYDYLLVTLCNPRKNLTINRLEKIARDIITHSEPEKFYDFYEISVNEMLLSLMFNIVRECTDTYYESV